MKRASPAPPAPQAPRRGVYAAAVLLLGAQLALGLAFIRSAAPTYDESVHLASGYSYLVTGSYRFKVTNHPPFAQMWAALPLLALSPDIMTGHRDYSQGRFYSYADVFLYKNRVEPERMLNSARAFALLTWSALLAWALFSWGRRLGGDSAGLWAVAAAALCPVLVSNLSLVTTDGASAALFFVVFKILSEEPRGWRRWAVAGVCAGLGLAAKFNMILLVPLLLGTLALEHALRPRPRPALPLTGLGVLAASAAVAIAAVYRFSSAPLWMEDLIGTLRRLEQGRSAFFLGQHSTTGFLLYFPGALLVKTPLPLLALAGAGLFYFRARREALWILLPMLGYFLAAQTSKVQIGVRHMLPMMPFLALCAGVGAARLAAAGPVRRAAAWALSAWLALSVLRCAPHLLPYFNELAGGPAGGYRWLSDSNLDWGQGLKALGAELKALGSPPIYFSYFGIGDPAAYGIRYVPVATGLANVPRSGDAVDPAASGRVILAVSVTNLQCTYHADKALFDWLKQRRPLKVVAYSIFLYDLTADREARAHLARLLAAAGDPSRAKTLLVQ